MGKKHTDNVSGGDIIFEGIAGEAINGGQGVWHDDTTEEWFLVENGTAPFIMWGIALEDAGIGKTFSILFSGVEAFEAPTGGIDEGAPIYIDSATSELTMTATGNQQIGHALESSIAGDDFLLHVDNPGVGITGGVEETLASNTTEYFNNLSTTSVEIDFGGAVVGIEVINDHSSNTVAVRFDATDAVIPSAGASLNEESIVRPKEKRFFGVTAQIINIIASASSTPVRVTGWLA